MVPAYTLPKKLDNYVVMRVVVRQGFSRDMADMLLGDIKNAVEALEKLEYPTLLASLKTKTFRLRVRYLLTPQ